jgi:hypothetical protein
MKDLAPWEAKALAIAAPMPKGLFPPVTSTTLFFNPGSIIIFFYFFCNFDHNPVRSKVLMRISKFRQFCRYANFSVKPHRNAKAANRASE